MKKSIFLFFAAILCAMSASAWSYKSDANGWQASTSGTQVQMTAGADYTYTADVTFSNTGESYTISGGTVNGATIEAQNSMPSGGKPASLTMSNSYTSKNSGNVHIVFDLKTNKVTETADSEPEPVADVTVHVINSAKWAAVACYHWGEGGAGTEWPGDVLSKTDVIAGYDVYTATFTGEHTSCIFNNNNNGKQTGDLTVQNGQYYDLKSNKWYASLAEVPTPDPLATDVFLVGSMNAWSTTANEFKKVEEGSATATLTMNLEAETEYEFKVVREGAWTSSKDNSKITGSVSELVFSSSVGDNTMMTTTVAGDYVFTWNDSKLSITYPASAAPEPTELTYNVTVPAGTKACYICGNMTGWSFTEMTKVDDTHYTITIEGAKQNDGYKYASGSDWGYVEKDANGNEIGDRTYVDGNDVVARWASVYDPDAVEQELTYSVTVPEGTYACYIAMDTDPAQDGWEFNEMTKVDDTHYTFTRTGLKNKTYKYASGAGWEYVEKTAEDGEVADRTWAENDVVAKWASVYNPSAPTYDYYLTGSLVGGWDVKQQGIEKDGELYKATFNALAAGTYEFKITAGDWEHQWNYNNLGAAYEEVSQGVDGEEKPNGNIKIITEEVKNITVIFDATAGKITFDGLTPYVAPLTYTVTVPAGTEKCYIAGAFAQSNWNTFLEMEQVVGEDKFTITITGAKESDEYKYACQADWAYAEVIDGGGNRTHWSELDEVTAWGKPVVYTYYLMGVNGDWTTGIEMEVNTGAENEVMLTCQPVNGEVKIKRVGDDESEYWYGGKSLKDEPGNLGTNTEAATDGDGNIALEEGIYNFYFNTADGKLWIAAATDCGLATITLTTGNNDDVIAANIGETVNVKIERSFTANDGYYTLCVPFNMPASVIGKAYSLGTITEHVSGQGININLEEESELLAGVPYLVLPKANMSELVVENVTIQSDIASGQNVTGGEDLNVQIFFEGFYSAPAAPNNQTNGTTQYYVGEHGYLYNEVVDIRGLSGLFTITDKNGAPLNVRARVVTREEVETGIDNNQLPNTNIQKVLENGQLIIIREGVKYNVQGQKL